MWFDTLKKTHTHTRPKGRVIRWKLKVILIINYAKEAKMLTVTEVLIVSVSLVRHGSLTERITQHTECNRKRKWGEVLALDWALQCLVWNRVIIVYPVLIHFNDWLPSGSHQLVNDNLILCSSPTWSAQGYIFMVWMLSWTAGHLTLACWLLAAFHLLFYKYAFFYILNDETSNKFDHWMHLTKLYQYLH